MTVKKDSVFDSFRDFVAESKWFHAIDFGEFSSSGRFADQPQNKTLFPAMEILLSMPLKGLRVLDIGAFDGIVAFGASALGADVTATDIMERETLLRSRDFLEEGVSYLPNVKLNDLPSLLEAGSFDVVICNGIFYHLFNPFESLLVPSLMLKPGGILILETVAKEGGSAALEFNPVSEKARELSTYFVPTKSVLAGMASLAALQPRKFLETYDPYRLTLLASAVTPELQAEDSGIKRSLNYILENTGFQDPLFSKILSYRVGDRSLLDSFNISETSLTGSIPNFPYQPRQDSVYLGSSKWLSREGNHAG